MLQSAAASWLAAVVPLIEYPVLQLLTDDVLPDATLCAPTYQLPLGVVHAASALTTRVPAAQLIVHLFLAVPLPAATAYPDGQLLQLDVPP